MKIFDLVEKWPLRFQQVPLGGLCAGGGLRRKASIGEFAATISADMQNTDKVVTFIDECRPGLWCCRGCELLRLRFGESEGDIVYGLGAIKGLGEAIETIVSARADGGGFKICSTSAIAST